MPKHIPYSTYRIQFHPQATFQHVHQWLAYLDALGIDWLYSSPLTKPHPGSLHGYDTVDFSTHNPELGDEEAFKAFVEELHRMKKGLLVDFAPNHMDISCEWAQDVVKRKQESPYAPYFDVDWSQDAFAYRRFADIDQLIALNIEKAYEEVHAWILSLVRKGWIQGLRIDHIDGIANPQVYLECLRQDLPNTYIVVEKVLSGDEKLSPVWKIEGTVGYDTLNQINQIFIQSENKQAFLTIYESFIGSHVDLEKLIFDSKKQVLLHSFKPDLHRLEASLIDFLCSFPVYRTYPQNTPQDSKYNAGIEPSIPRFQQLTAELMAKGYEDTALYRYFPLASINEVGCQLDLFGLSIETFHRLNQERQKHWPYSLVATSTHDTKRSEDVRARLNVLSEIPQAWQQALNQWHALSLPLKKVQGPRLTRST